MKGRQQWNIFTVLRESNLEFCTHVNYHSKSRLKIKAFSNKKRKDKTFPTVTALEKEILKEKEKLSEMEWKWKKNWWAKNEILFYTKETGKSKKSDNSKSWQDQGKLCVRLVGV